MTELYLGSGAGGLDDLGTMQSVDGSLEMKSCKGWESRGFGNVSI